MYTIYVYIPPSTAAEAVADIFAIDSFFFFFFILTFFVAMIMKYFLFNSISQQFVIIQVKWLFSSFYMHHVLWIKVPIHKYHVINKQYQQTFSRLSPELTDNKEIIKSFLHFHFPVHFCSISRTYIFIYGQYVYVLYFGIQVCLNVQYMLSILLSFKCPKIYKFTKKRRRKIHHKSPIYISFNHSPFLNTFKTLHEKKKKSKNFNQNLYTDEIKRNFIHNSTISSLINFMRLLNKLFENDY